MIRFGSDLARVKTLSEKDGEDLSIEIGLIKNKKSLKIDGIKKSRLSELLENVYVVIFSPDDLRIVKEEPEKRRKFIDRELCQLKPVYYDSLSKYKKALSQRNFLLKEERDVYKRQLDGCSRTVTTTSSLVSFKSFRASSTADSTSSPHFSTYSAIYF